MNLNALPAPCAGATAAHHTALLDALAAHNAAVVTQHPFVRRCIDGSITLPELTALLAQQGKYSSRFTRYLCALIANLEDNDDVMLLAHNLAEELGLGHNGAHDEEPHARIFARMLDDFGVDRQAPALPATQALIDAMFNHCRRSNPVHGLAALCLGAESIVPALYSALMRGFIACGVAPQRLEFFRIHIECDDGHGAIMRDILVKLLQQDPGQLDLVYEASHRIVNARLDFFSNLEGTST